MPYYQQSITDTLIALNSQSEGLSEAEAKRRLDEYGPNELEEKKKVPAWLLFLKQFKDFMILILVVAAVLSGIIGDLTDTLIILFIVLVNAVVGFVQEYRAEKSMEALKSIAVTSANVQRDGKPVNISSTQLVPGDIVLMEAGNVVPADIRLIEAHSFKIDESSLTGESVAADKSGEDIRGENIPLGDRFNMAYKGTLITNGRATGVVTDTGMRTELGKIAGMLQEEELATPLQKRMVRFGKTLTIIILVICAMLFTSGVLRGEDTMSMLLLSVSLMVAAIPESLPALITIALAGGASRMVKQNALIRKLPAVETLGSVGFICTDKTGTLTQNKMTVVKTYQPPDNISDNGYSFLQLGMALNHDVQFNHEDEPFGEPTELAMVEYVLREYGIEKIHDIQRNFTRVAELPFDSDRKRMTTIHQYGEKYLVLTKGAGEAIGSTLPDKTEAAALEKTSEQWAANGIRVLAFAFKIIDRLPGPLDPSTVECSLHFAGLTGLTDPPREEVKQAISECKTAGITTVMITGDHPATAQAIARDIGILYGEEKALTGTELAKLGEEEFLSRVDHTVVYARVSPDQKLRIVRALQKNGHFTAMTGDGVNDAPSLKAANIGVAMGINGTDVSKEAAHIILLDDNFATIVKAVKEGRRIFDNIRKFVKYILTCNSAEIWTISIAPLLAMPIPLLPIHILWINLVTDGIPALALAGEKSESDAMQRPPRPPRENLFADGVGIHVIWVGILMAAVTLFTQAWAIRHGYNWQTMVFTVLSVSQLGHVLAIRSDRTFLFRQGLFSNKLLMISIIFTFLLQMAVVYVPFLNAIFKTEPLSLVELGFCIGMSAIVFHAVELEKWIKRKLKKNALSG